MGEWLNSLLTVRTTDPAGGSVSIHSADALPLPNCKPTDYVHASKVSTKIKEQSGQSMACAYFGGGFPISPRRLSRAPCLPCPLKCLMRGVECLNFLRTESAQFGGVCVG